MKIGILIDSYRSSLREALRKAASTGAAGVQCYANAALFASDPAELRQEAKKVNLEFSALVAELGGYGFQIEAENADKLERMKAVFDMAVKLGARAVTGHVGVIPADPTHPRYRTMLTAITRLGREAKKRNLSFGIETGPEAPETLADFLARTDGGIGVNLDPANLVMVRNVSPVHAVELLNPWIIYTHAKDGLHYRDCDAELVYDAFARGGFEQLQKETGRLFEETPLGVGAVDFPEYIAALRRYGYDGYLTVERETGSDPESDIRLAVDFLKKQLG